MKKIIVFGSGNGSNFQSIVEYFKNKDVEFVCVSNKQDAFILQRAKLLGIKHFYVPYADTYKFLEDQICDLVILAGYMRILPANVLKLHTFINIHPSLLPAYKGKDAIKRAFDAKENLTGVSVHYVNEEVDSGEIIVQQSLEIRREESLLELESRIHNIEHYIYPRVIDRVLFNSQVAI